ncbi:hypothetical protein P4O66_001565 [Electrophorus voltai]|uniref:Reverse transcriptase domain-containing protein n=1 Tax=Electrophorus voltai TaxID=2609070 RepID=A0AAD8Z9E5_9TELE|nr:hypothetical protein P4O66_001565 [Electrophorus voltai]
MLFVDYSSAFNTIIPSLLTTKLEDLGLHTSLCDWISNFLTDRPHSVRVGNCASSTLTLSTGAPQGCVLSPLLYSLYTYDCTATSSSNIIVKFADDTVVMGLILHNDERAYLEEIKYLENWCQENNLLLNVSKTKELIVDCSKKQEWHYQPVRINGTTVERVDSFRYLGVHISQDLSWSRHTNSLAKKARQRLYHLRRLRDFRLPSKVLRNFYTCTIESILTGNITVRFGNSTKQDRQALQRVVRSAERITHTELPDLQTIYYKRCQTKARRIVKDPTHPNNRLFSLLRRDLRPDITVNTHPETSDITVNTHPETPDITVNTHPETSDITVNTHPETPDITVNTHAETSDITVNTHPETPDITVNTHPETSDITVNTHPETPDITVNTHPETSDITVNTHPETSDITVNTHPETSDIKVNTHPETSDITVNTHPETPDITVNTHPETPDITVNTHPETSDITRSDDHPSSPVREMLQLNSAVATHVYVWCCVLT